MAPRPVMSIFTGFVIASQNLAIKLAHAQTHGGLPGGILVIIEGTIGATNKRVLLIIKAEPHNGFTRDDTGITYLQGIFLTPATRFYKVGAFVEEIAGTALPAAPAGETHPPTAGWASILYDEHITKGNRMHAAQYFYSGFLGLEFPANNAFQTKVFFELTKKFLLEQDLPSDKKSDLLDGLYTYLKVDTSPHVHVSSFATQYVSGQQINETPALQDSYRNYMAENAFPTQAIPKDLSELEKALRQREWRFSNNMRFVGPADMFKDMVTMSIIAGHADDQGVVPEWTQIVVKDKIRSQE